MESRKRNKSFDDEQCQKANFDEHEKPNLSGDYGNITILTLLYLMQGIPLGITYSMPFILQNKGVSYKDQAAFSFAFYPFTMKILWAPIIDSVYLKSWGRRKSWMVPSQLMIGTFMIFMSWNIDEWLGGETGNKPKVLLLATMFFILYFLTATQDIAVDGWSLTMLQRRNVSYGATCNQVGQTFGYCISVASLLILESKDFCNTFIYSEPRGEGLITFASFLRVSGVAFTLITILIAFFKREESADQDRLEDHPDYGIKKAYPALWKILQLKPVQKLSLFTITMSVCTAACDAITNLKLIEYGIPREKVAAIGFVKGPILILVPLFLMKQTSGKYPMNLYMRVFPLRVLIMAVMTCYVFWTPTLIKNGITSSYLLWLALLTFLYHLPEGFANVSLMSFNAKISDPLVGGTYLTLLSTIGSLGYVWIKTFFLWLVDIITWKSCIANQGYEFSNSTAHLISNNCIDSVAIGECVTNNAACFTHVDGFFIEVAFATTFGVFWYYFALKLIRKLQNLPIRNWHVLSRSENPERLVAEKSKTGVIF